MRLRSLVVSACSLAACGPTSPGGAHDASSDTTENTVDASLLPPDPCGGQTAACPEAPTPFARGDGLRAIDRCAFPLVDKATWTDRAALVDALPASVTRVTLSDVLTDLNRTAVPATSGSVPGNAPGITRAFSWQSGDESVTYWIPQGITGSFDGRADGVVGGKKVVLVSWYYEMANDTGSTADKGVRIAVVDATSQSTPAYRFALLVAPVSRGGRTDFDAVRVHAGGLAWFGDLLYVPVTGSGFRVFDLTHILKIDGTEDRLGYNTGTGLYDAHGYKYVIPQVGELADLGTCSPVFSYVSVDRTSTPPSLISGEYVAGGILGRIYRWPLDPVTGHLQITDAKRVMPDAAYVAGESNVQGTLSHGTTFWMSSSAPAGSGGALYRAQVDTASTTLGWIDSPEDLAYDPQLDAVWSLSEALDARYVIAVSRSSIE